MGNIFAGSEIVEIGVQIEKNGRDFYNELFSRSKNQRSKEIFQYLAGEEVKHIVTFRDMLSKVEKYQPQESYPEEYFAYMNALAGDSVFTQKDKGAQIAKDTKSDREAIDIGIKAEKDSIIFYEGMKRIVPQHELEIINALITQEQGHLRQLADLKKTA